MRTFIPEKDATKEDVWIKSTCSICFNMCAIKVHRVDGRVVKIEGNPDCPSSNGGICARGPAALCCFTTPTG